MGAHRSLHQLGKARGKKLPRAWANIVVIIIIINIIINIIIIIIIITVIVIIAIHTKPFWPHNVIYETSQTSYGACVYHECLRVQRLQSCGGLWVRFVTEKRLK